MIKTLITRVVVASSLILVFALGACKKPVLEPSLGYVPPLVLSTSIYDSLPAKAVHALKLNDITGLKVKHHNGMYANYFEYEADKVLLLNTISALPFSMHARAADSSCHQISFGTVDEVRQNLPKGELEHTAFFWNSNRNGAEVYQCIKPPYRHIIQIQKNSTHVLHRIEFIG